MIAVVVTGTICSSGLCKADSNSTTQFRVRIISQDGNAWFGIIVADGVRQTISWNNQEACNILSNPDPNCTSSSPNQTALQATPANYETTPINSSYWDYLVTAHFVSVSIYRGEEEDYALMLAIAQNHLVVSAASSYSADDLILTASAIAP
jgi:hypothetical protein